MSQTVMQALDIMWKGMAGIFVALIVIMVFVWIMTKIGGKKKYETLHNVENCHIIIFGEIIIRDDTYA